MAETPHNLIIPFGTADPERVKSIGSHREAESGSVSTNLFRLNTSATPALRLHHGPYDFRVSRDLGTQSDAFTSLTALQNYSHALCDLWRKTQHVFVEAYFDFIRLSLEKEQVSLTKDLAPYDGIYTYKDWSFSALRPLPRAHLATTTKTFIPIDFIFWTGKTLIAVDIVDFQTQTRARQAELEALNKNGVVIISAESAKLTRDRSAYLALILPKPFHLFWYNEVLPQSPFKPEISKILCSRHLDF